MTQYLATEQDMRERHPEAGLVPRSREERDVDEAGLTAGHVQRGRREKHLPAMAFALQRWGCKNCHPPA